VTMIIYLALGLVFDAILSSVIPVDFASVRLSMVSHMAFMGVILLVYKMNLTRALIIAALLGLIIDLGHEGYITLHALVYVATVIISRYWSSQVNDEYTELTILLILSVFIKELIIWALMRMGGMSSMSMLVWFTQHQALSLLFNVPLAIIMIQFNFIRLRIIARQNYARQKGESLFLLKLESRVPNDMV
jgi:rod shape-determining protein MreD